MRIPSLPRIAALTAYALLIAWATLQNLHFDPDLTAAVARLGRALRPTPSASDLVDAARNVVLFAGWGALWVSLAPTTTLRRTLGWPLISGLALSAVVETVQLFSPVRAASVLDLATNGIGALAGAVTIVALAVVAGGLRDRKSFVGIPAVVFAGAYSVGAFVHAVILGRPELVPGVYGGPFTRIQVVIGLPDFMAPGPFTWRDIPLFIPLGWLAVAAMVESGASYGAAMKKAVVWSAIFAVVAEFCRAPLGYPVNSLPLLVHGISISLGAWAASAWLPKLTPVLRGRTRARAVAWAYGALLLLWTLQPYAPRWDIEAILSQFDPARLVPLGALAGRMDLYSVADILTPFFLYLPLGAFLAVWPVRRGGWLSGPLPGVYLALASEVAQILVEGRWFSGTDILVQGAAVVMGWVIIRRAGFPQHGTLAQP